MWDRRYLAVMGFQALLALPIIVPRCRWRSRATGSASSCVVGSPLCAPVFWLLVRVMARLQVPPRTLAGGDRRAVAGFAAGGVNAIVGSGSLITFPTLLRSATRRWSPTCPTRSGCARRDQRRIGYRRELRGQWRRDVSSPIGTSAGALLGGILLLALPEAVFDAVVPC